MTTSPQDSPHSPQQGRAAFICTDVHRFSAGQDAGPVAQTCRAVLDGYGSGLSPLDARMLGRLVRLGDLIPEILANEARLTMAIGALRQVQVAFDNGVSSFSVQ